MNPESDRFGHAGLKYRSTEYNQEILQNRSVRHLSSVSARLVGPSTSRLYAKCLSKKSQHLLSGYRRFTVFTYIPSELNVASNLSTERQSMCSGCPHPWDSLEQIRDVHLGRSVLPEARVHEDRLDILTEIEPVFQNLHNVVSIPFLTCSLADSPSPSRNTTSYNSPPTNL